MNLHTRRTLPKEKALKVAKGPNMSTEGLKGTQKGLVSVDLPLDSCVIAQEYHPADKMFSLYWKKAEKVDRQMVEDWKGTTDGIFIFVRGILLSDLVVLDS
jgi:hypothetical protein